MEKKIICVYPSEKNLALEENIIFDWKVEKETSKNDGKIEISLIRDDSKNYYTKLVELEKNFSPKFIPLFVTLIPAILAFILMTIFLILFLTNKENFGNPTTVIFFMIPSSILLFLTVVLVYFRMKKMQDFLLHKSEKLLEIKKQIEEIIKAN